MKGYANDYAKLCNFPAHTLLFVCFFVVVCFVRFVFAFFFFFPFVGFVLAGEELPPPPSQLVPPPAEGLCTGLFS